jgi:hypothetical protein
LFDSRTAVSTFTASSPKLTQQTRSIHARPYAIPDAIGRTLLLTQFSILPLLSPLAGSGTLPPTPSTLILVPFILAVPAPMAIFNALNWFSPSPKLSAPAELKPGGWQIMDFWAPVLIPVVFLSLVGPVKGWPCGLGLHWSHDQAVVACMFLMSALFLARAVYNFGSKRQDWSKMLGVGTKRVGAGRKKTKTQ